MQEFVDEGHTHVEFESTPYDDYDDEKKLTKLFFFKVRMNFFERGCIAWATVKSDHSFLQNNAMIENRIKLKMLKLFIRIASLDVAPVSACKQGPLDVMLKCDASHWPEFFAGVAFMTPSCDVGDKQSKKKSRFPASRPAITERTSM